MFRDHNREAIKNLRYVRPPEGVDRPEWAARYDLGDRIAFTDPATEEVHREEVVGFSSITETEGLPCIRTPEYLEERLNPGTATVSIPERLHIPPEEAPDPEADADE